MSEYTISAESLPDVYPELEPLFRSHYQEMSARLSADGMHISDYNPRLEEYFKSSRAGWLKTYVVRHGGIPCGYANIYVTTDMHNNDLIAQEDTLYVAKEHRNGIGKSLVRFGLVELRKLGVKRLSVTAMTDLRVIPLWRRMGFKEVAMQMMYTF